MADLLVDVLSAVELADIKTDLTRILADTTLTTSATWHYLSEPPEGPVNPFSGSSTRTETTETVRVMRGHLRDSQPSEIVTGRYKFLALVAAFTGGTPNTEDVLELTGTGPLTVTAVTQDQTGLIYRIEATRTAA